MKISQSVIEELEAWHAREKGRYVDIRIGTTYGATCWKVTLGNVNKKPGKDWIGSQSIINENIKKEHAVVYAAEVLFIEFEGNLPPNLVIPESSETWPGLEKTILVAFKRAEEFGV